MVVPAHQAVRWVRANDVLAMYRIITMTKCSYVTSANTTSAGATACAIIVETIRISRPSPGNQAQAPINQKSDVIVALAPDTKIHRMHATHQDSNSDRDTPSLAITEISYQKLQQITNASNPVALIKTKWESTSGKPAVCKAHFQSHPITASILSKGAMVCLIEKNFEPEWSLFNNSIGEVEEIVFRDGDNPNNGDQPCYIAVKFPQYSGPAWDPQKPKVSTQ